jgi:DNA recombination-dependent growth factor C
LTNTDDDEDFEEIEEEEIKDEVTSTTLPTAFISQVAFTNFDHILKRCSPIP